MSAASPLRGSNLDQVRRRNLSAVLRLVHTHGSPSRAWITKETGLNRSTVAALVAELVELSLVNESEPDQTNQVGRPSRTIVPSSTTVALTVHPELDAVTVGLVGLGGRVVRRVRYDTVRVPSVQEVVNIVSAIIAGMRGELDSGYRTVGLGLAIPGLVRGSDGMVSLAPHLLWRDEPLAAMLSEATGFRVQAANDATVGAIAESTFGAGSGVNDMIYLNGGASGIGGGIMSGGLLLTGASGFAGELGHTLVNSDGVECHCGGVGCLETEVARAELLEALGLARHEAERLEDVLLAQYAPGRTPDAAVARVVDRQVHFLGIGLAGAANLMNPSLIVLGGFLGSLYRAVPHAIERAVRELAMPGLRDSLTLSAAALGPSILMIGAAELAFSDLLADPAGVE